jgi:5,10-methylenetetrahydromethanopterin reductase
VTSAETTTQGIGADRGVRFGTVTFAEDLVGYRRWIEVAERLGYDLAGYGDSQSLWADPYVALAVAAQATTRIRIGTMVTNPVTRHPAVTAGAVASLQQLSGGRVFCGLGSGDSALANIGEQRANAKAFGAYAAAVKGLCAGEEVTWEGRPLRMQWPVTPVPVWMSAEGPRTLRIAGQIADGVIIAAGISEGVIEEALSFVAEGARSAGRSLDDLEVWWMLKAHLAPSEEEAWHDLRWTLAGTANHLFRFSMEGKSVPEELREPIRALQREYAPEAHGKVAEAGRNASLPDKYGLTEWLGRRFLLGGPPEVIVERIRSIAARGATNLIFPQFVADKISFMEEFDETVVSAFR